MKRLVLPVLLTFVLAASSAAVQQGRPKPDSQSMPAPASQPAPKTDANDAKKKKVTKSKHRVKKTKSTDNGATKD